MEFGAIVRHDLTKNCQGELFMTLITLARPTIGLVLILFAFVWPPLGGRLARGQCVPPGPLSEDHESLVISDKSEISKFKLHVDIKKIWILDTAFGDENMKDLLGFRHLSELVLMETRITDHGIRALPHLAKLNLLNLRGVRISDLGVASLASLGELSSLDLSFTGVSDQGVALLAPLGNLKELTIANTKTNGSCFKRLKGLRKLESLNCVNCPVDSKALLDSDFRHLRDLHLTATRIDNDVVQFIEECKEIRYVDISRTKIDIKGIERLAGIPSLRTLVIANPEISERSINMIREKRSGLEIISEY